MHFRVFVVMFAICGSLQINAKPLDDRGVIEKLLAIAEDTLNLSERLEKLLENCENKHQPTTTVKPVTSPPTTPRHPSPTATHPWSTTQEDSTTHRWTTPRYPETTPRTSAWSTSKMPDK
ncbi:proteoglycan 4-like [Chelonus insularis]|uniref:proteoglycan 4-like n=1 Tax=Chelonus insularis TaxID=460826 RepID=UPI00158B4A58|nr:proteoglycan 4-like [Chelonus insularis]